MCAWVVGAGVLHVALASAGLGGWPCPFRTATGVPCPGCGLSRACALLVHGDLRGALRMHAFAPMMLAGLAMMCAGSMLPAEKRSAFLSKFGALETQLRLAPLFVAGFLIYWLLRFALDGPSYLSLAN
jgi:hypothetical protein